MIRWFLRKWCALVGHDVVFKNRPATPTELADARRQMAWAGRVERLEVGFTQCKRCHEVDVELARPRWWK